MQSLLQIFEEVCDFEPKIAINFETSFWNPMEMQTGNVKAMIRLQIHDIVKPLKICVNRVIIRQLWLAGHLF
jgi:hypothetical protein